MCGGKWQVRGWSGLTCIASIFFSLPGYSTSHCKGGWEDSKTETHVMVLRPMKIR